MMFLRGLSRNQESGIQCTLTKLADDSKLSGAVDKTEGRDDIQKRNLERFEKWPL